MDRRTLGERGEQAVARHLETQGFCILARNARVGRLELDLVAQQGSLLVFCEVKSASGRSVFGASERLSAAQQQRLRRAAADWLRQNPGLRGPEIRFDAAFVTFGADDRDPAIEYFAGAF